MQRSIPSTADSSTANVQRGTPAPRSTAKTPSSPTSPTPAKKRRAVIKLDADKLLSKEGLPRLRALSLKLSFKGRGHEQKDLRTLMTFYQIWGHGLFPKLRFESLAERCEVVCRERRMRIFFDAVLSEERRRRVEDAEQQREDDSRRDQEDGEDGMDVDDGSHHRDEDTPALEYPSDGDEDEEAPAMDETINDDVDERVRGMMDSPPRSSRSRPPSPPSSAPRLAPLFSAVPAPTPVPPLNVTAPPPADEPGSVAHSAAVMEKMAANKAKALAKLAERRRIREEMERQEEEAARELAE